MHLCLDHVQNRAAKITMLCENANSFSVIYSNAVLRHKSLSIAACKRVPTSPWCWVYLAHGDSQVQMLLWFFCSFSMQGLRIYPAWTSIWKIFLCDESLSSPREDRNGPTHTLGALLPIIGFFMGNLNALLRALATQTPMRSNNLLSGQQNV